MKDDITAPSTAVLQNIVISGKVLLLLIDETDASDSERLHSTSELIVDLIMKFYIVRT